MHRQALEGVADHLRVEVAALAGVDLDRWCAGRADAVGVEAGLLVTFDHRNRELRRTGFQRFDGRAQQRGLARAGAGDEVQRRHAVRFEVLAVVARDALVLAEDVGLELDRARLAHARHRNTRRAGPART